MQSIAASRSVLQYVEVQALSRAVAVGRSEVQSCSVLQCVAVQALSSAVCVAASVAVSCSELLCIAVPSLYCNTYCNTRRQHTLQYTEGGVRCSEFQCVAASCSALQRVAVQAFTRTVDVPLCVVMCAAVSCSGL